MTSTARRDRGLRAMVMTLACLAAAPIRGAAALDAVAANSVPADVLSAPSGVDYARAVRCLTQAIYYEAGSEPMSGQQAVAQVVLNRVRHPAFPKSVCGVVFDGAARTTGCQFTFTCDGSLFRLPAAEKWAQAQSVAAQALGGYVDDQVGASTHYHASWMTPYWRPSMVEIARIGGHVFYRMAGPRGSPSMLTAAYAGVEPDPASLQSPLVAPGAAARRWSASGRIHRGQPPARASRPATFSVWGLDIATVVPSGQALMVHAARADPSL